MDQRDVLGHLRQRLADLVAIAQTVTGEVRFQDDDDLALMAVCFLSKQIGHAESVLLLGESTDVVLIVRAMLEGICQLKWAAQEPTLRAKKWRDFVWVHDSRAIRAHQTLGQPVDPPAEQVICDGLHAVREMFFTRDAAKALKRGAALPANPFYANWTGMAVQQIFAAVGADERYAIYKSFSDWQHWSIGGIGRSLIPSPDGMNYVTHENGWNLVALVLAFQCLWDTTQLVNNHLKLGLGDQLQRAYDQWFHEAQAALADVEPEHDAGPDQ